MTAEENAKAEAFFAGFDPQTIKVDPIGPTAELVAENERLSVQSIASALMVQQLQEENAKLRARIDTLEEDKGWLREQMTRPRP